MDVDSPIVNSSDVQNIGAGAKLSFIKTVGMVCTTEAFNATAFAKLEARKHETYRMKMSGGNGRHVLGQIRHDDRLRALGRLAVAELAEGAGAERHDGAVPQQDDRVRVAPHSLHRRLRTILIA